MVKDEFMKYKAPTNSIPTYKLYDFEASLNYKPLEYYTSLSTDEYNKLGTELKANIEFTKWAYKNEVYWLYRFGYMKTKLTCSDKIYNFFPWAGLYVDYCACNVMYLYIVFCLVDP